MKIEVYKDYPQEWEEVISIGVISEIFRFNIHKIEDEFESEYKYECEEVEYAHKNPLTEDDYGKIVSCIIRGKYSEDDVEAIVNNYLDDPHGHKPEFDELQKWRSIAKKRAREIIDSIAE